MKEDKRELWKQGIYLLLIINTISVYKESKIIKGKFLFSGVLSVKLKENDFYSQKYYQNIRSWKRRCFCKFLRNSASFRRCVWVRIKSIILSFYFSYRIYGSSMSNITIVTLKKTLKPSQNHKSQIFLNKMLFTNWVLS